MPSFLHLQQLHLFAAGFGAQEEPESICFLAFYKCKAPAQLQDEGFQLAQDGGLQVSLVVALAQALEALKTRGFDRLSSNGLEGLAAWLA